MVCVVLFFVRFVPLSLGYRIGAVLGYGAFFVDVRDRRLALKNLERAFPELDREIKIRLVKSMFVHLAWVAYEVTKMDALLGSKSGPALDEDSRQALQSAVALGRGVVVVSGHIGNWELGAAVLSLTGYPVNAVVLTHQNKLINDFFTKQRQKVSMIPIEIGATLRACYRTLRKNGLLALLGDRDFSKNGLSINFFGREALVPKGPGALSYREGTAILPVYLTREDNDSFLLSIEEPIYADRTKPEEEAIRLGNDTDFGLGSYVFTDDPDQAMRVADGLDTGMVYVNGVGADSAELPFGGVKRSGFGRELGRYGIEEFVNKKLIRVIR